MDQKCTRNCELNGLKYQLEILSLHKKMNGFLEKQKYSIKNGKLESKTAV